MEQEETYTEKKGPIFIVGMARSGTTLLRSILNSHPNIAIPRETTFFYLLEEYFKKNKINSYSKNEIEKFWNWYSEKRRFTYLGLNKDEVKKNINVTRDVNGFKNVFNSVMNTYKNNNKKSRWGEKSPGHEEYLDKIFEFYPNAKILFMIRDPRAIYSSMNNVPWNNQFVSVIIKRWNNSLRDYYGYKEDKRIKMITYEELVTNTRTSVESICNFIGENFEERMLNDRRKNTLTNTNDGWTTKYEKEVTRQVDNSSIEKWKNSINKIEIAAIEKYSNQLFFSKYYNKSNAKMNVTDSVKYQYLKIRYYAKSFLKKNEKSFKK